MKRNLTINFIYTAHSLFVLVRFTEHFRKRIVIIVIYNIYILFCIFELLVVGTQNADYIQRWMRRKYNGARPIFFILRIRIVHLTVLTALAFFFRNFHASGTRFKRNITVSKLIIQSLSINRSKERK